ncbi:MAG: helix-turn-helix transcriptional regulator [bacterium]|nr:helix-turn-helix transcriptional regulator [bacterium]
MYVRISELCAKKGITITQLERELGFGRATIQKWKNSSPSADKLSKVADYFKVSTDYLIGRTETKELLEGR